MKSKEHITLLRSGGQGTPNPLLLLTLKGISGRKEERQEMENLKSIKQLKQRRDLLVNAKTFSIDEEDRTAFQKAIDGLEAQMYRKVKIAVVVVSILVLLSILASGGCNSIEGMRMDIHQWTDTPAHHK